jgi:hypothetical protein
MSFMISICLHHVRHRRGWGTVCSMPHVLNCMCGRCPLFRFFSKFHWILIENDDPQIDPSKNLPHQWIVAWVNPFHFSVYCLLQRWRSNTAHWAFTVPSELQYHQIYLEPGREFASCIVIVTTDNKLKSETGVDSSATRSILSQTASPNLWLLCFCCCAIAMREEEGCKATKYRLMMQQMSSRSEWT